MRASYKRRDKRNMLASTDSNDGSEFIRLEMTGVLSCPFKNGREPVMTTLSFVGSYMHAALLPIRILEYIRDGDYTTTG
ncbi:MAG: hypothetical protein ACFFD4_34020 [Candidatus Odinarchaeota archaeon]